MDKISQNYNIVIVDDEPIVTSNLKTFIHVNFDYLDCVLKILLKVFLVFTFSYRFTHKPEYCQH